MSRWKGRGFAVSGTIFADPTFVIAAIPLLILALIAVVSFIRGCAESIPP
jgi:hypothetical protein